MLCASCQARLWSGPSQVSRPGGRASPASRPELRGEATAGSGPKRLEGREGEDSGLGGPAGAPVGRDSKETDGIHQD